MLQQKLETSFYSGQFGWDDVNPNDAAALLKKFIRELPAPLLTSEYVNTFSAVRGGRGHVFNASATSSASGCVHTGFSTRDRIDVNIT